MSHYNFSAIQSFFSGELNMSSLHNNRTPEAGALENKPAPVRILTAFRILMQI